MANDPELLRLYADTGSDEAFAELVRRHIDFAYATALRRSRNPQRAEDITQVAFVELARQSKALCQRSELVGWLYTTIGYTNAKLVRTEVRRERREREAQLMADIALEPGREADWEGLRPVVDDALGSLKDVDRTAILLRFFKNCTMAEVAASLRLSEEAARKRVSRALDRLRDLLAKRGITSSAAALAAAIATQQAFSAPSGLAGAVAGAAIASGPASGSSLSALLSGSKLVAGLTVATAALSLALAGRELIKAGQAESELAVARISYDSALSQLRTAQTATRTLAARRQASARAAGASLKLEVAQQTRALTGAHPEIHGALLRYLKASCRARFQQWYAEQHLSPAQIDQFENLLIAGQSFFYNNRNGQLYVFRPSDPPPQGQIADGLKGVLGEAGFAGYLSYYRSAFTRTMTEQFATAAASASDPLSSDQVASLEQSFAAMAASKTTRSNWAAVASSFDWETALGQARAVLSPSQAAVLSGFVQQVLVNEDLGNTERWVSGPDAKFHLGKIDADDGS